MYKNLSWPLLLTWFRILLVPVFLLTYYIPDLYITAPQKNLCLTVVFLIACLTDYLDGYLARLLKQESDFGAFLDPVADKAIIAASLVVLIALQRTWIIAAVIIIVREITISALREWMATIGRSKGVTVAYIGKLKTLMQMCSITLLLFDYHNQFINTIVVGNILMLVAVFLTIMSMFYYLEQAKKQLNYESN